MLPRLRYLFLLILMQRCFLVILYSIVVLSDTVNTFKHRLDRFWHDQPIMYDSKAEIKGTGNQSWY